MRIELGIIGRVGAVMPAHVPRDYVIAAGKRFHLSRPHPGARAIAMREQDGRALTALLVINIDSIAIEIRHDSSAVGSRAWLVADATRSELANRVADTQARRKIAW